MVLADVNIFIYAHREDTPDHPRFRDWLETTLNGDTAFGVSDVVLSGFLRVVTHPKVFSSPTPLDAALQFVEQVKGRPNAIPIRPGARHWSIFTRLCRQAGAKGNIVPDAYLAALAIESGCEWVSTDRDFSRFPDLRWRHPFPSH